MQVIGDDVFPLPPDRSGHRPWFRVCAPTVER
jgi:hypothetical protein